MITFRPATMLDDSILWNWRNDRETRKNSFTQNYVLIENHMVWLRKVIAGEFPNRTLLIAEDGDKRVGTVRIDIDPKELTQELSWTVAPFFRNQGYGKKMMIAMIKSDWIKPMEIIAKIRSFNQASIKMALLVGFELVGVEAEDTLIFKIYPEKLKDHKFLEHLSYCGKLIDDVQALRENHPPQPIH